VDLHAAQTADRAAGREAAHYADAITPDADGARSVATVFAAAMAQRP
jgi:hypothetical protein